MVFSTGGKLEGSMRRAALIFALCVAVAHGPAEAAESAFRKVSKAYRRGDYATALAGYSALARKGNAEAQFRIGIMHDKGRGVPENDAKAIEWFRRAADWGHLESQINLGVMYAQGQGVRRDNVTALFWFTLASKNGSRYALSNRQLLTGRMSSRDITAAEKLAEKWKPKKKRRKRKRKR
jgi:hypothetical protein